MSKQEMADACLRVVSNRCRNLRKTLDRARQWQNAADNGVTLNEEQLESIRSVPRKEALLTELQEILRKLTVVTESHISSSDDKSSSMAAAFIDSPTTTTTTDNHSTVTQQEDDASKSKTAAATSSTPSEKKKKKKKKQQHQENNKNNNNNQSDALPLSSEQQLGDHQSSGSPRGVENRAAHANQAVDIDHAATASGGAVTIGAASGASSTASASLVDDEQQQQLQQDASPLSMSVAGAANGLNDLTLAEQQQTLAVSTGGSGSATDVHEQQQQQQQQQQHGHVHHHHHQVATHNTNMAVSNNTLNNNNNINNLLTSPSTGTTSTTMPNNNTTPIAAHPHVHVQSDHTLINAAHAHAHNGHITGNNPAMLSSSSLSVSVSDPNVPDNVSSSNSTTATPSSAQQARTSINGSSATPTTATTAAATATPTTGNGGAVNNSNNNKTTTSVDSLLLTNAHVSKLVHDLEDKHGKELADMKHDSVESVLNLFHVCDFLKQPGSRASVIMYFNGMLTDLDLDLLCYFYVMLTSPNGYVSHGEAVRVSTAHCLEFLKMSASEAFKGTTYARLHEIVARIGECPLLTERGKDSSMGVHYDQERVLV